MPSSAVLRARIESSLGERLSSALLLREHAVPLTVPIGVAALDVLTGGLPRGALSEITGPASSGRTGVMLAALAGATWRQEVCALVDASDSFDPASAAVAGVDLDRLLWVRCARHANPRRRNDTPRGHLEGFAPGPGFAFGAALEQVLKVTDLLLQAGGFGMVVLDLGDIPVASARRVPLTSWFRFRRAVEPTATVLLLVEQEPSAKSCASLAVCLQAETVCACDSAPYQTQEAMARRCNPFRKANPWNAESSQMPPDTPENNPVSHAALLHGMCLRAQVVRCSTTQRKPAQSTGTSFELRAAL
ncbi:MAG: hypothetical protein P4M04_04175 [Acidobacteriota bacterium]|nr:hypothetical protein [Acidobacteriota bacterium]